MYKKEECMKVIILSASTGGGHMSAANAIKDYLISKNHTAEVIDTIEYISPFLNKTVTEIYEYVATKSPMLWKLVYKSSNNKSINFSFGCIIDKINVTVITNATAIKNKVKALYTISF